MRGVPGPSIKRSAVVGLTDGRGEGVKVYTPGHAVPSVMAGADGPRSGQHPLDVALRPGLLAPDRVRRAFVGEILKTNLAPRRAEHSGGTTNARWFNSLGADTQWLTRVNDLGGR